MKSSIPLLFVGHILACSASSVKITANFDNLTVIPIPMGGVGTYEDVIYNAFTLAEQSIAGTGVAAHTAPNIIDTTSQQQGTNGTPSLTPAAPYTSIGLVDFWFGCNLRSGQGVVAVQTQCTIVVAAFDKQDKEVEVASYTFTPPTVSGSVVAVPMIHAVLPSSFWGSGIKNVTVVQGDPVTQALLMDSITYYLYK